MPTEDASKQDAWRDRWYDLKLTATDGSGHARTGSKMDAPLGNPTVDLAFALQIIRNANVSSSERADYNVPEWGALALLRDYKESAKPLADPTTWAVRVPLRSEHDPDGGMIRLKLKFDRPLPDLKTWPEK
jgi:hypothetical protein